MTKNVREREVEKYLTQETEVLGAACIKVTAGGGFPDRAIFWPDGSVCLAETKRPYGSVISARQVAYRRKLENMGHHVHFIYTKSDVDNYVTHIKNERNLP